MPGINRSSRPLTDVNTAVTVGNITPDPTRTPPATRLASLPPGRTLRNQRSNLRTPRLQSSTNRTSPSQLPRTPRARAMSIGSARAPLTIDFIIVGAGICGLATAFALAQSGHRVRVFERHDGIHQRSVGVRVPPNLSKILYDWGLQEELSKASKCLKSTFVSLETNQPIGILEWQEDVIKETGGDFLLLHYDDLYNMLYRLAVSQGAKISFGTDIKSVEFDEEQELPTVKLTNGTVYTADLVIGADGYNSIVRDVVTGAPDAAIDSGMSFFSIVVPAEKIKDDPEWSKWLAVSEWPIWMGNGRNVLGYPIRNGQEYCVHAYHPDKCIRNVDFTETWTKVAPTSLLDHEDAHPSIKRIFSTVPDALRVKYMVREIIDDWVDESGTIMLIGEAAHSMMPCTIHNLALAVEDAAVLGVLMSHLRTQGQIPQILEGFQDLRFSRIQQVKQSELSNAALTTLPPGEHRDMRDVGLGQSLLDQSLVKWDDERLREQWEEISFAFGYNALEAAEDWWLKWGALGDAARLWGQPQMTDLVCQISEVAVAADEEQ